MTKQAKIDEAAHFLTEMKVSEFDLPTLQFKLSAFLSAARTPLQYAVKDIKRSHAGESWFATATSAFPLIEFLGKKRNISIHDQPVVPNKGWDTATEEQLPMQEVLGLVVVRGNGNIEEPSPTIISNAPTTPPTNPPPTYSYRFSDWPGTEDVITLCEKYLQDVRDVVADGVAKGVIKP